MFHSQVRVETSRRDHRVGCVAARGVNDSESLEDGVGTGGRIT